MMDWKQKLMALMEELVFEAPASPLLFNPYKDEDAAFDIDEASAIRRDNFRAYLDAYSTKPDVVLLAEAPGPWGCRFSGVPLVSEALLVDPDFPIHGRQTSLEPEPHHEYSARIYWRALQSHFPRFFTWNSVPFHPYHDGKPLSIRTPKQGELMAYKPVVEGVVSIIQPEVVLAIGRKAESVLGRLGIECTYIRHPSQGGATIFTEGVTAIFQQLTT